MQVGYDDRSLEKLCTDEKEMKRKRGDIAGKLQLRIKALETAENVAALTTHDPGGKWHQLTGNLNGLWAGRVSKNHRILIRPEGDTPGAASVTVTVVEVGEDYH